jgi:hypothetical protein
MLRSNLKRERPETGYDYHWKYPALLLDHATSSVMAFFENGATLALLACIVI